MVIVNCDQDHRPEDLKPLEAAMASTEPDTPGVTAPTMLAATDSPNENTNTTRSSTRAVLDASISEVWYLKPVAFGKRHTRIITQNFNGLVSVDYRTAALKTHNAEHRTFVPQTVFVHCHL